MTNFYDFNIAPKEEIIDLIEKFGFKGACIFYDSKKYNDETLNSFNNLNEITSLNLYHGICIDESNPQLLRKEVQRYYQKVDLIMVNGGNIKINRSACEMPQVDILNHPYLNKRNSGINHILAKMLKNNNITVNINFCDILMNRGYYKARILNQINQLLFLQKKYGFRTILSSGSTSFYDVRSPESMLLLSSLLDINSEYAKKNISTNITQIITDINKHKNSIVDGVQIIKD